MTIYLNAEDVEKYLDTYMQRLDTVNLSKEDIDKRIESHLKNTVVIKYTQEWQDKIFDELMHIWTEVPGGYWILQDYMHSPHVEFEHYKHRCRKSYEKGNVSLVMAKRELTERQYKFYKHVKKYETFEDFSEEEGKTTECHVEVEGTLINPKENLIETEQPKHL